MYKQLRKGGLVHHVHQGSLFSVMVIDVLLLTRTEKSASYSEVFRHSGPVFEQAGGGVMGVNAELNSFASRQVRGEWRAVKLA